MKEQTKRKLQQRRINNQNERNTKQVPHTREP